VTTADHLDDPVEDRVQDPVEDRQTIEQLEASDRRTSDHP
jgi:hypothetical protein